MKIDSINMYFIEDFPDGRLLPRFRRGLLREVPPQDDGLPVGLFVEALLDVVGHLSDSTVDFFRDTHFNTFTTVRCPSFCVRLDCSALLSSLRRQKQKHDRSLHLDPSLLSPDLLISVSLSLLHPFNPSSLVYFPLSAPVCKRVSSPR